MQRPYGQCTGCTYTLNTLLTGVGWCLPCARCREGNIAWTVEVVRKIKVFQACVFRNKSLSKLGCLCAYTSQNQKMFPRKRIVRDLLLRFISCVYFYEFCIYYCNSKGTLHVSVISSAYFGQAKLQGVLPHGAVHWLILLFLTGSVRSARLEGRNVGVSVNLCLRSSTNSNQSKNATNIGRPCNIVMHVQYLRRTSKRYTYLWNDMTIF